LVRNAYLARAKIDPCGGRPALRQVIATWGDRSDTRHGAVATSACAIGSAQPVPWGFGAGQRHHATVRMRRTS